MSVVKVRRINLKSFIIAALLSFATSLINGRGFPYPFIEQQANGCPPIAADCTPITSNFEWSGFILNTFMIWWLMILIEATFLRYKKDKAQARYENIGN